MASRSVNLVKTPPRVDLIGHRLILVHVDSLPPLLGYMVGEHDLVCDYASNLGRDVAQAMIEAALDFHTECADALEEVELVMRLSFPKLGRLKRLNIRPPPSPPAGYTRQSFVVSYDDDSATPDLVPSELGRIGLAQAPINMFRLVYPPQGPRSPPWLRSGTFFDLTEDASPRVETGMGAPQSFKAQMSLYLHALTRVCGVRDHLLPAVAAAAGRTGIKLQMRVTAGPSVRPQARPPPALELEQNETNCSMRQFSFDLEALEVDILANGVFEVVAPNVGPARPWHAPAYMYLVSEREAVIDVHAETPQWRVHELVQLAAKTHELQYPATRQIEDIVTAFDPAHPRLHELVPAPPKVKPGVRRIAHSVDPPPAHTSSKEVALPQLAQVDDSLFALHYPEQEGLKPSIFDVRNDDLDLDERLDEERIVMVETLGIVVQQLFT